jgi:hypothetical protein
LIFFFSGGRIFSIIEGKALSKALLDPGKGSIPVSVVLPGVIRPQYSQKAQKSVSY